MRIAVDTNRYRDFSEGLAEAVERFRSAEQIYLPFVVLAELRAGFLAGSTQTRRSNQAGSQNAKVLTAFLNRPRVRVLWPDQETTHQYARLWNQLSGQGTPIPSFVDGGPGSRSSTRRDIQRHKSQRGESSEIAIFAEQAIHAMLPA